MSKSNGSPDVVFRCHSSARRNSYYGLRTPPFIIQFPLSASRWRAPYTLAKIQANSYAWPNKPIRFFWTDQFKFNIIIYLFTYRAQPSQNFNFLTPGDLIYFLGIIFQIFITLSRTLNSKSLSCP